MTNVEAKLKEWNRSNATLQWEEGETSRTFKKIPENLEVIEGFYKESNVLQINNCKQLNGRNIYTKRISNIHGTPY